MGRFQDNVRVGQLKGLIESYKKSPRRHNPAKNKAMLNEILELGRKIQESSTDADTRERARILLVQFASYLRSLVRQ